MLEYINMEETPRESVVTRESHRLLKLLRKAYSIIVGPPNNEPYLTRERVVNGIGILATLGLGIYTGIQYEKSNQSSVPVVEAGPMSEQLRPADIIEAQLKAHEAVRYFNGSLTQQVSEGTKTWPNPVVTYKNTSQSSPFDINSYSFFTISHCQGVPIVREIPIEPGMKLNGPTNPGEPFTREAFLEPFTPEMLTPQHSPRDSSSYFLKSFAGQSDGVIEGGVIFIGTETLLESGK